MGILVVIAFIAVLAVCVRQNVCGLGETFDQTFGTNFATSSSEQSRSDLVGGDTDNGYSSNVVESGSWLSQNKYLVAGGAIGVSVLTCLFMGWNPLSWFRSETKTKQLKKDITKTEKKVQNDKDAVEQTTAAVEAATDELKTAETNLQNAGEEERSKLKEAVDNAKAKVDTTANLSRKHKKNSNNLNLKLKTTKLSSRRKTNK